MSPRLLRPALLLAAAVGLAACSNYSDRGYGYSRVSLGIGSHSPYYGWYDGYYYPGNGYYVYDRRGDRHRWSDRHRHYWEARRGGGRHHDNWSDYQRDRRGDAPRWGGDRPRWDGERDRSRDDRARGDWNRGDRSREHQRSQGDRDRARSDRHRDKGERRHRENRDD